MLVIGGFLHAKLIPKSLSWWPWGSFLVALGTVSEQLPIPRMIAVMQILERRSLA